MNFKNIYIVYPPRAQSVFRSQIHKKKNESNILSCCDIGRGQILRVAEEGRTLAWMSKEGSTEERTLPGSETMSGSAADRTGERGLSEHRAQHVEQCRA